MLAGIFKKTKTCASCTKKISFRDKMVPLSGRFYHAECILVCNDCTSVTDKQYSLSGLDGVPLILCEICYSTRIKSRIHDLSTAPQCRSCQRPILLELPVEISGAHHGPENASETELWHAACLNIHQKWRIQVSDSITSSIAYYQENYEPHCRKWEKSVAAIWETFVKFEALINETQAEILQWLKETSDSATLPRVASPAFTLASGTGTGTGTDTESEAAFEIGPKTIVREIKAMFELLNEMDVASHRMSCPEEDVRNARKTLKSFMRHFCGFLREFKERSPAESSLDELRDAISQIYEPIHGLVKQMVVWMLLLYGKDDAMDHECASQAIQRISDTIQATPLKTPASSMHSSSELDLCLSPVSLQSHGFTYGQAQVGSRSASPRSVVESPGRRHKRSLSDRCSHAAGPACSHDIVPGYSAGKGSDRLQLTREYSWIEAQQNLLERYPPYSYESTHVDTIGSEYTLSDSQDDRLAQDFPLPPVPPTYYESYQRQCQSTKNKNTRFPFKIYRSIASENMPHMFKMYTQAAVIPTPPVAEYAMAKYCSRSDSLTYTQPPKRDFEQCTITTQTTLSDEAGEPEPEPEPESEPEPEPESECKDEYEYEHGSGHDHEHGRDRQRELEHEGQGESEHEDGRRRESPRPTNLPAHAYTLPAEQEQEPAVAAAQWGDDLDELHQPRVMQPYSSAQASFKHHDRQESPSLAPQAPADAYDSDHSADDVYEDARTIPHSIRSGELTDTSLPEMDFGPRLSTCMKLDVESILKSSSAASMSERNHGADYLASESENSSKSTEPASSPATSFRRPMNAIDPRFSGIAIEKLTHMAAVTTQRDDAKGVEWAEILKSQDIFMLSDLSYLDDADWPLLGLTVFAQRAVRLCWDGVREGRIDVERWGRELL
ncbi:uncharacterized protein BJ171DRAFT_498805 [Polychytrium aggregatum]|uniref:uncharacterized protein n=1 Tax=Polychytrium aggregatum TaxID=110093 RepID=UPI0022FEA42A|nr:uncharacterized protein BJ171DRAFT_498805 [Polychytrium aggregatum]KAI9206139.1 hypothetical protein BJ171DRAFT_498805 [Polychytrium aggregatum]